MARKSNMLGINSIWHVRNTSWRWIRCRARFRGEDGDQGGGVYTGAGSAWCGLYSREHARSRGDRGARTSGSFLLLQSSRVVVAPWFRPIFAYFTVPPKKLQSLVYTFLKCYSEKCNKTHFKFERKCHVYI
jgi:hypothetical protein